MFQIFTVCFSVGNSNIMNIAVCGPSVFSKRVSTTAGHNVPFPTFSYSCFTWSPPDTPTNTCNQLAVPPVQSLYRTLTQGNDCLSSSQTNHYYACPTASIHALKPKEGNQIGPFPYAHSKKNCQGAKGYIRFFGDKHSKKTSQIHPCPMNFDINIQSHHFDQLQKKTSTKSMNAFTTQSLGHQPLRLTQFQQNGLKATAGIGSGFSGGVSHSFPQPMGHSFIIEVMVTATNIHRANQWATSGQQTQFQPPSTPAVQGLRKKYPKHVK